MARMTKTSKENLQVADRLQIVEVRFEDGEILYHIRIFRGDNMAYLSDSQGPIAYKSVTAARRVVKRVRPDLEPTSI